MTKHWCLTATRRTQEQISSKVASLDITSFTSGKISFLLRRDSLFPFHSFAPISVVMMCVESCSQVVKYNALCYWHIRSVATGADLATASVFDVPRMRTLGVLLKVEEDFLDSSLEVGSSKVYSMEQACMSVACWWFANSFSVHNLHLLNSSMD